MIEGAAVGRWQGDLSPQTEAGHRNPGGSLVRVQLGEPKKKRLFVQPLLFCLKGLEPTTVCSKSPIWQKQSTGLFRNRLQHRCLNPLLPCNKSYFKQSLFFYLHGFLERATDRLLVGTSSVSVVTTFRGKVIPPSLHCSPLHTKPLLCKSFAWFWWAVS